MRPSFLADIDWHRPWLVSLRAIAEPIIQAADWREALNECADGMALCNHQGLPIRFVPQSCLPPDSAYESFISATGCVPTRENLHDFFNALVWLTFPHIKVRLNALQATAMASAAAQTSDPHLLMSHRGRLRDAITIFDENAALFVVRDHSLVDALRAHRWREIFVERRDVFGRECEIYLFGHALMEKLVRPYKAITAHVWPIVTEAAFFELTPTEQRDWLDAEVAWQLSGELATSHFAPMPVLGVPGWWHGQDDVFYEDVTVFRPKRRLV